MLLKIQSVPKETLKKTLIHWDTLFDCMINVNAQGLKNQTQLTHSYCYARERLFLFL
jgi:hypothetical protein